jgi:hypothetical protein
VCPSFHVWRHYSRFWAAAFLKRRLHPCLSPACLFCRHIPRDCNAPIRATSSHLFLGFATNIVLWNIPLRILFICYVII